MQRGDCADSPRRSRILSACTRRSGAWIRRTTFDRIVADLKRDREVRIDPEGIAHFDADDGMPFGLRVWNKRPIVSVTDPVNTPGTIRRLNQHRQWRARARPKTINHVVFFVENYRASWRFLRDRLGFRYSDHSRGVGVFGRADGTYEHHSIFLLDCKLPVAPGKAGFMHAAFGVDDIDELMIGANYMEKKRLGEHFAQQLGRRIAASHFLGDLLLRRLSGRRAKPSITPTRTTWTTTGCRACGISSSAL